MGRMRFGESDVVNGQLSIVNRNRSEIERIFADYGPIHHSQFTIDYCGINFSNPYNFFNLYKQNNPTFFFDIEISMKKYLV